MPMVDGTNGLTSPSPALLAVMPRQNQRRTLGINSDTLPFDGVDVWNAYEFTWLNLRGKPLVATARFEVPAQSTHLIESKSLKLYLGSFSHARFESPPDVEARLISDLSRAVQTVVGVTLLDADMIRQAGLGEFTGTSLDDQDIEISEYIRNSALLELSGPDSPDSSLVKESLYTHLFRSLCPITGQPDLASLLIRYEGRAISHAGLLKYLVSYREHAEFAEQVAERVFVDLMQRCAPEALAVTARYTRRGGIDINAHRCVHLPLPAEIRLWRQ